MSSGLKCIKISCDGVNEGRAFCLNNDLKIHWKVEGERTLRFLSCPSSLADLEMHWFPQCSGNKALMNAGTSLVCLQGKAGTLQHILRRSSREIWGSIAGQKPRRDLPLALFLSLNHLCFSLPCPAPCSPGSTCSLE